MLPSASSCTAFSHIFSPPVSSQACALVLGSTAVEDVAMVSCDLSACRSVGSALDLTLHQPMSDADSEAKPEMSRHKRKEEGKRQKRQRIEQSGGVRPRRNKTNISGDATRKEVTENSTRTTKKPRGSSNSEEKKFNGTGNSKSSTFHRFGRVMESVPSRNQPRLSTLSIAVPGSVVANCQTRELKTLLVGQIARAATIYHVDEIIVFDDRLTPTHKPRFHRNDKSKHINKHHKEEEKSTTNEIPKEESSRSNEEFRPRFDPHTFMARVLQYCECPQYLRKHFFPMHPDLQFCGLLAPIDAPHHVRALDRCPYREGVVLEGTGPTGGSLVNCGIRNRPVE